MSKRFALMLAIFVGLLPFGFSYGFSSIAGDNHVTSHMHSHADDCAGATTSGACIEMSSESPLHDDCCSDHCDSSFGSQLCSSTEFTLELPVGHRLQSLNLSWIAGPVPPTLLRPPQTYS